MDEAVTGPEQKWYHYKLMIQADSQMAADRVFVERIGYDEELEECGVGDYTIDGNRSDGKGLSPLGVLRETFQTQHDQYADRNGQPFEFLRVIEEPDDTHDEEVLPMYVIRFNDGVEVEAWPDEVTTD